MARAVPLLLLLAVALPAYASGEPGAIFIGLAQVLILGAAIACVAVAKRNWAQKVRALLPIAGSMAVLVALDSLPGYKQDAMWLAPLLIGVASLGALLAWRLVRRDRTGPK